MKTKQFITIIISCLLILAVGILGIRESGFFGGKESYVGSYISVIWISGTIGETSYDIFGNETSLSTFTICDYLDQIAADRHNKGLFIEIDSPGGSVYDSDKIYQALMEYKELTGRPIVAACLSTMCSGAYYIASAADEIYAERTADVGSIGVYIEMMDVSELAGKLGVKVDYIRSSENKAMGNMYNAMTDEQRAIYQSIIDEHYERFLDIVQKSRGYDRETLRKIADGRSYTATQALQNGLIDGIKEYDDVLLDFEDQLGVYTLLAPEVANEDIISAILRQLPGGLFGKSEIEELKELLEKRNGRAMYHE
ncbi:MAG: signal peptide peptidase SppA [Oscillospiraceae bacterium]|nr:signal peptide peptidase SppA [Oscillospiraceae bacterium]